MQTVSFPVVPLGICGLDCLCPRGKNSLPRILSRLATPIGELSLPNVASVARQAACTKVGRRCSAHGSRGPDRGLAANDEPSPPTALTIPCFADWRLLPCCLKLTDASVDEKGQGQQSISPKGLDRWRTHSQLGAEAKRQLQAKEAEAGLVSTGVGESYDGHRQG